MCVLATPCVGCHATFRYFPLDQMDEIVHHHVDHLRKRCVELTEDPTFKLPEANSPEANYFQTGTIATSKSEQLQVEQEPDSP